MEKITLKLRYKDDLRRVSLRRPLSISEVEEHVTKVFGLASFVVTYVDEEGDKIIISTNEEVEDLVSDSAILRLNVEEKVEERNIKQECRNVKVEKQEIPKFSPPVEEPSEPNPPSSLPFVPPPFFPQFSSPHEARGQPPHPFQAPPLFPSFCPPPIGLSYNHTDNQCCPFGVYAFLFLSFLVFPMFAFFSFRAFLYLCTIGFSFIVFLPIFRCIGMRMKQRLAHRHPRKHRAIHRVVFKAAFFFFVFFLFPFFMYSFNVPLIFGLPVMLTIIALTIRRCVKRCRRQNNPRGGPQSQPAAQEQAPVQDQAPEPQPNQPQITSERLEALSRLVSMGFELKAANEALEQAGSNDFEAALNLLL